MTGELSFIEQLDLQKLENERTVELTKVKAEAQVKLKREETKQRFISLLDRNSVLPWLGWTGGIVVAAVIVSWAVWGIHHLATSGPPKTPEQIQLEQKQERFENCVRYNGNDDGKHDNVWYPTAEGGDGLCLPKDKPAPTTGS